MDDQMRGVLILVALAVAGLAVLAAAGTVAEQSARAGAALDLAEVSAWQVSQVLDDVRRITADAAARQARGEVLP